MNIFAIKPELAVNRVALLVIPYTGPFSIDVIPADLLPKNARDLQDLRYELTDVTDDTGLFSIRTSGFRAPCIAFMDTPHKNSVRELQKLMIRMHAYTVDVHVGNDTSIVTAIVNMLNDKDRKSLHMQQMRSLPVNEFCFRFVTETVQPVETIIDNNSLFEGMVIFDYVYSATDNDILFNYTVYDRHDTLQQSENKVHQSCEVHQPRVYYDQYLKNGMILRVVINETSEETPIADDRIPFTRIFEYITLRYVQTNNIDIYRDRDFTHVYKILEKHADDPEFYSNEMSHLGDSTDVFAEVMLYPTFRKVLVRELKKYPTLADNCVSLI